MHNKTLLVGFFALAAFGGLTFAVVSWTSATATLVRELDSKINRQVERIDDLQALVSGFDSDMKRLGREVVIGMANATRLAVPMAEDSSMIEQTKEATISEEIVPEMTLIDGNALPLDWQEPLVLEYEGEWGQSDWGRSTADAIEQAIPDHPFFGRFGGSFIADCREQTCRVEWLLPNSDDLSSKDREELLSMARYEMLALAAANATDVGQLTTEWSVEDGPTSIATTFKRSEANHWSAGNSGGR